VGGQERENTFRCKAKKVTPKPGKLLRNTPKGRFLLTESLSGKRLESAQTLFAAPTTQRIKKASLRDDSGTSSFIRVGGRRIKVRFWDKRSMSVGANSNDG